MPCPYVLLMLLFSAYYAWRGVLFQQKYLVQTNITSPTVSASQEHNIGINALSQSDKIIIHYLQEIIFKFVITISSFISLYIAYYICYYLKSINDIKDGTAILLVFLFMWGVIGISGYLTHLIAIGKLPGKS